MVYSELANWDGSLDPGPSKISPQHNLITAVKCAGSEGENRQKALLEHPGSRNGDTAFAQNVKDSVSRAMAGRTHRHVNSRAKQSGRDATQDQIIITSRNSSTAKEEAGEALISPRRRRGNSGSKQDGKIAVREKIIISPKNSSTLGEEAGEALIPPKRNNFGPLGIVKRTYGRTKSGRSRDLNTGIRDGSSLSASSKSKGVYSDRPPIDEFWDSEITPNHEVYPTSRKDSLYSSGHTKGTYSNTLHRNHSSSSKHASTSYHSRASLAVSHLDLPELRPRSPSSAISRTSFGGSLSDIINNQHRRKRGEKQALEPQKCLQRQQPGTHTQTVFDCVLIPPHPFKIPRELYKTLEEYDAEKNQRAKLDRQTSGQVRTKNNELRKMGSQGPKQKAAITEPVYVSSRSQTPDVYPPRSSTNSASIHIIDSDFDDDFKELGESTSSNKSIPSASVPRRRTTPRKRSNSNVKASRSKKITPGRIQVISDSGSSSSSEDDLPVILDAQGRSDETAYIPSNHPEVSTVESEHNAEELPAEDDPDCAGKLGLEAEDAISVNNVTAQIDISSPKSENPRANTVSQPPSPSKSTGIHRPPSITIRPSSPADDKKQETMRQPSPMSTLTAITSRYPTPEIDDAPSDNENASDGIIEKGQDDGNVKKAGGEKEVVSSEQVDDESEDELDDVCHYCRNRNVYAKMRCANLKGGEVCGLHFCHRCMAVNFPDVDFDPFSGTFHCPACQKTCFCLLCCKKRGIERVDKARKIRWYQLGITLLLSQQESRRKERRAAGKTSVSKPKPSKSSNTQAKGAPRQARRGKVTNIGSEAENWIQQNAALFKSGTSPVRAFVGSWRNAWGAAPKTVVAMECVEVDVHAATNLGKGKGKAIDADRRLFVGDPRALNRPHLRADNVLVTAKPKPQRKQTKKPTEKRRKPTDDDSDEEYMTGSEQSDLPNRKKQRIDTASIVPVFTLNHPCSSLSSASPSMHQPTPENTSFPGFEPNILGEDTQSPLRAFGVTHDPLLGAVEPGFGPDNYGDDIYGFDWEIGIGTKSNSFTEPTYSYQGTYDSYVAELGFAAGLEEDDPAFRVGYGYGDALPIAPPMKDTVDIPISQIVGEDNTNTEQLNVIDPELVRQDSEQDPMQFLTAHACASTLMSGPMIYGVPSSTGLSLHDLERSVRASLIALETQAPV